MDNRQLKKNQDQDQRSSSNVVARGWLLAFALSCPLANPGLAERTNDDAAFWRSVQAAQVIYVGEIHNDPASHRYEIELITALAKHHIGFAVGWEMFSQEQQPLLNSFDRRKLTQAELFDRTGFNRSWAVDSDDYARILEQTQKLKIQNIALNASPDLVRKVAHADSLTAAEEAEIPRDFAVPADGLTHFRTLMGSHPGLNDKDLVRFYAAQNVWDQTMATNILNFVARERTSKLVVLTGRAHVSDGFGVPRYVKQKSSVGQLILFPPGKNDLKQGQKAV
jgi:uncharacterized iron-regulated protein